MRLIDENEKQVGLVSIEKALMLAKQAALDLVEVAPNANPPVCRIMDFGKFLYKQKKIEQSQRKAGKKREVKGIRLSMRTDTHDMEIKAQKTIAFLKERNPVKISLILRGREMAYQDLAREKMKEFSLLIGDHGELEMDVKRQGFTLTMMYRPK